MMALLESCPFSPSGTERHSQRLSVRPLPQRPPSIASLRGLFVSSKFDVQLVRPPLPGFHFTPTRHQFGRSAVTRRNTSAACRVDEVCKKQFTTAICQATQFAASSSKLSHAPVKYRTMRGSPLAPVDDENLAFVP